MRKSGSEGSSGSRRRDRRSLFGLTVVGRIQAIVTLSQGAIRMPKEGYAQGLFNKTPGKPRLVALAVKREKNETQIHVGVDDDGEYRGGGFSVSGVLTSDNAEATGKSILTLLGVQKDSRAIATATEKLLALGEGESVTFRRDDSKRLQITSGGGE